MHELTRPHLLVTAPRSPTAAANRQRKAGLWTSDRIPGMRRWLTSLVTLENNIGTTLQRPRHMPRLARQHLASLLAAIIAVVGGTGEALYYLIEADSGQPAQTQGHQRAGYYHQHGDGLWHHHGPTHNPADVETTESFVESRVFDGLLAVRKQSPRHRSHSCFVLALVSQFQQSLVNVSTTFVAGVHVAPSYEVANCRIKRFFAPALGARGPPPLLVAV